jgi:pimeloyl-ACP methyl ester carboxylesterase
MSRSLASHGLSDQAPLTRCDLESDGEPVAVYQSGVSGSPLLLIHSINAAASVAEVEPLRARYGLRRRVYCLDLPGFGESARTDRVYSPRLMTNAILTAARAIYTMNGKAIDALAVSLSCEFLARAANEQPSLFNTIALVSPTAFTGTRTLRGAAGQSRGKPWLYKLLRGPGWGRSLFRQLTRPSVIRYFLERTWGSKHIDEGLWRADVLMAQYPGAHFAPLYFLSALLFSADIHDIYDSIRTPVWVSHGKRGDFVDYRQLPTFAARNQWSVTVFNTGAMVYFEEINSFIEEYDRFTQRN